MQTIIHSLIHYDVPLDIKEVAESIEFVLRAKNRFLHCVKQDVLYQRQKQSTNTNNDIEIHVHDLCAGHGLTGLILAACLYHSIRTWILQQPFLREEETVT